MIMTMFQKAERSAASIKLAITGPSGSGKTYGALKLARGLVGSKGRIAFVDTENGSGKLYYNLTEFFHCNLDAPFEYQKFIDAVQEAEQAGFNAVVIDSLSHLWQGILDETSNIDRRGGNQYTNWTVPTAHLNETIQTILQSKIHVIACLRVKTEYVLQEETNSKGKSVQVPKKVGLAPVMRDGIDYEFSSILEIGIDHKATASKDRTGLFVDKTFQITEQTGEQIADWLSGNSVNQEPTDSGTETENFIKMIQNAKCRGALGKIGLKIKESTLPESEKEIIRGVYRERSNSLA
jgi:energy-coupling factor transporter ATP-binding protein EcfA2